MKNEYDYMFKLLILGDSGVGKTCFLLRFVEDNFSQSHIPTIGIDYKTKLVDLDGIRVKLQIWDTAGQERFKTITKTYYSGAMGIILAYDCTRIESFENIKSWLEIIKLHANERIALVLIGNKSDANDIKVTYDMGLKLGSELDIQFFSTSARNNLGVSEAVNYLARQVYDRKLYQVIGNAANVRIAKPNKKKKSCC
jgi:small GTP-binding protein